MSTKLTKVRFGNTILYVDPIVLEGNTDGPLSPEHHVKNNELDFEVCFLSDTYAHIYGRHIQQFGAIIGTINDLVVIKE